MKSIYEELEEVITQRVMDSLRGMILVTSDNVPDDPTLAYATPSFMKARFLEVAVDVLGDAYGEIKSVEMDDSDLRDLKFKLVFEDGGPADRVDVSDIKLLNNWAEFLGENPLQPYEDVDDFRNRLTKARTLGKTHDTVIETVHFANRVVDYVYSEEFTFKEIMFVSPAKYRKLMIFIGLKGGNIAPWSLNKADVIQCSELDIVAMPLEFLKSHGGGEDVGVIVKPSSVLNLT